MDPREDTWRTRFAAFTVNGFDVALDRPERGVVAGGGLEPHQLHAWDRGTGELRRITSAPRGILEGWISADGAWVYFLDDPEGSEEGVLVRVPWEGGEPEPVDPDLGPGAVTGFVAQSEGIAFTHIANGRYEHRVAYAGDGGSRLVVADTEAAYVGGLVDEARTLITVRYRPDGSRETVLYDVETGHEVERLAAPGVTHISYTASPVAGDARLLAETDETGVRRPYLWDRVTRTATAIPIEGLPGDVRPLAWSPDGSLILLLQVHQAATTLHLFDVQASTLRPLSTPNGALTNLPETFATMFASATEILTTWQDGATPRTVLSIPVDGGTASPALAIAAAVPGHPWRSITFPSADGTPLQGWLATPGGNGPFPAVVDIHGGPFIAEFDWFIPQLQAFVDHGFAVLSVNYRGSGTFGTTFQEAIIGRPGELEIEDVAAAADYLVAAGIADPARIVAEGWSYGGYLTLMALSRQPDRWAGGLCGVGIADFIACHAQSASYIAGLFETLLGGTPEEADAAYRKASPITWADDVRAPLLVIHGRNDVRCPAGQMEGYLARMAELGKDVTVEWFEAGHLGGVADPGLDLHHTELMLAFAARVAGGSRTLTTAT